MCLYVCVRVGVCVREREGGFCVCVCVCEQLTQTHLQSDDRAFAILNTRQRHVFSYLKTTTIKQKRLKYVPHVPHRSLQYAKNVNDVSLHSSQQITYNVRNRLHAKMNITLLIHRPRSVCPSKQRITRARRTFKVLAHLLRPPSANTDYSPVFKRHCRVLRVACVYVCVCVCERERERESV